MTLIPAWRQKQVVDLSEFEDRLVYIRVPIQLGLHSEACFKISK